MIRSFLEKAGILAYHLLSREASVDDDYCLGTAICEGIVYAHLSDSEKELLIQDEDKRIIDTKRKETIERIRTWLKNSYKKLPETVPDFKPHFTEEEIDGIGERELVTEFGNYIKTRLIKPDYYKLFTI